MNQNNFEFGNTEKRTILHKTEFTVKRELIYF